MLRDLTDEDVRAGRLADRDAAEEMVERAAGETLRAFLARLHGEVVGALTASARLPRGLSPAMVTLGQVSRWWEDEVDGRLMDRVREAWAAGRAATVEGDAAPPARSADAAADYLARVRDRLSTEADPPIPDQAMQTVREALAEEQARGASVRTMTDRLGAELRWEGEDAPFWRGRLGEVNDELDLALDRHGPPGSSARDAARRGGVDARVDELQRQRSAAVRRLDADRSRWQVRSERIARTEAGGAWNAGAEQAYAEEGVAVHVWVATHDGDTRDDHAEAHGQCVPVGEPFVVGGEQLAFPGDPSASAENVVNCRCTTVGGDDCADWAGQL